MKSILTSKTSIVSEVDNEHDLSTTTGGHHNGDDDDDDDDADEEDEWDPWR